MPNDVTTAVHETKSFEHGTKYLVNPAESDIQVFDKLELIRCRLNRIELPTIRIGLYESDHTFKFDGPHLMIQDRDGAVSQFYQITPRGAVQR